MSGGEANPVQLCVKLDRALQQLKAPAGVVQPAFGMTETCAGCTYNTGCPGDDVQSGMDFASLGRPVGGFEVRVVATEVGFELSYDEKIWSETTLANVFAERGCTHTKSARFARYPADQRPHGLHTILQQCCCHKGCLH